MENHLTEIVRFLDERLRVRETGDYSQAVNGLQLENGGTVHRVAAAVDASLATVTAAIEARCDLLLVHHGLFWNGLLPLTGNRYRLFRRAMEAGLAIYSAHLPLDAGEEGNSALLAGALRLDETQEQAVAWQPFFEAKGTKIGCRTRLERPICREELSTRLSLALEKGPVRACPGGPDQVQEIGVVTGAAGSEVRAMAAEGLDTLITGEGPHWTFALAEEVGINILYGGHYATETLGVKKLAETLRKRFELSWEFIDRPTGL